ncbi:MAG: hypothetical protein FD135_1012 [Comamonadaceae bacterium]|nr:MAG: hypothetical protein FD135_1012 [Comamonadaceae bacterium]
MPRCNKLLFATAGHTAAELVVQRADPNSPNMSLTHWSGSRVRKHDVVIAKNYLTEDEIDTLNRLVVIFLEQAELRVKQRHDLTLDFWRQHVDGMLAFNGQAVLQNSGSVSHDNMVSIAHARYETFDDQRRAAEATEADAADLQEIEFLGKRVERQTKITAAAKPTKKTPKGKNA